MIETIFDAAAYIALGYLTAKNAPRVLDVIKNLVRMYLPRRKQLYVVSLTHLDADGNSFGHEFKWFTENKQDALRQFEIVKRHHDNPAKYVVRLWREL